MPCTRFPVQNQQASTVDQSKRRNYAKKRGYGGQTNIFKKKAKHQKDYPHARVHSLQEKKTLPHEALQDIHYWKERKDQLWPKLLSTIQSINQQHNNDNENKQLIQLKQFLNIFKLTLIFIKFKGQRRNKFGFDKYCETRIQTLSGTSEYLAPEILLNKGHRKPIDWWT